MLPHISRSQVLHATEFLFESPNISVEIRDQTNRRRRHIVDTPFHLIEHYAPDVIHLIEFDSLSGDLVLPLRIRSLENAEDIEIHALTRLFNFWLASSHLPNSQLLPHHASVSKGVLMYRALQILHNPSAENLRARLMQRLRNEALTETDVQTIWWTFQSSPEFPSWLDALMYNMVRLDVFISQPTGGYISLFIETELLRLSDEARGHVLQVYERNKQAFEDGMNKKTSRRLGRAIRRVFC